MRRFFYTLKQSFLQVYRNRAMALGSVFAITAMMLILSIFFIIVINVNTAAQAIQDDYDSIELFLEDKTTKKEAEVMISDLKTQEGVDNAYYKTKEDALKDLRVRWGENAYLLDSLVENPLPNSIVIEIGDLSKAEGIANVAETYKGIEDVKFYKETVDKLLSATRFIQIAAIVLMAFLVVVSIVVVSNTIKLTVLNRSREINIMKYIGATNWFIRGPFLGEGIIIGIVSAAISVGVTVFGYTKLVDAIGEQVFSILSVPMVPADFLALNFTWIFLALGVSIGACGSIISMRKFLDK